MSCEIASNAEATFGPYIPESELSEQCIACIARAIKNPDNEAIPHEATFDQLADGDMLFYSFRQRDGQPFVKMITTPGQKGKHTVPSAYLPLDCSVFTKA